MAFFSSKKNAAETPVPEVMEEHMQKAMVAGGSKITFEGTEEEYEAVKDKLHPKTKVTIKKASAQRKQKTTNKTTR